jgi:hypothetical protein
MMTIERTDLILVPRAGLRLRYIDGALKGFDGVH